MLLSSRPGYPTAPRSPPKCDVALALTLLNPRFDSFLSDKKVNRSYLCDHDFCVALGRVNQASVLAVTRGRHARLIPGPLYHISNKRRDTGPKTLGYNNMAVDKKVLKTCIVCKRKFLGWFSEKYCSDDCRVERARFSPGSHPANRTSDQDSYCADVADPEPYREMFHQTSTPPHSQNPQHLSAGPVPCTPCTTPSIPPDNSG